MMKHILCLLSIAVLLGACAHPPPVTVSAAPVQSPSQDIRKVKLPSAVNPEAEYSGEKVSNLRAVVYWNTQINTSGNSWSDIAKLETLFYGNTLSNQTEKAVSPADLSGGVVEILSFSKHTSGADRAAQTALLVELRQRGFDIIDPNVFSAKKRNMEQETLSNRADVAIEICKKSSRQFFGRIVRLNDGLVLAASYPKQRPIPGSPSRPGAQNDQVSIKKLCNDLTKQVAAQMREQK